MGRRGANGCWEPTEEELEEAAAKRDKIQSLIAAGVHPAEAGALQEDLEDIKAGRPAKPSISAPKPKKRPTARGAVSKDPKSGP
jgi:hypothetical protein